MREARGVVIDAFSTVMPGHSTRLRRRHPKFCLLPVV